MHLAHGEAPLQPWINVLPGETLRIVQQVTLDQIGREVAQMIATHPIAKQAQLFQVAAAGDGLHAKILKDVMKVALQNCCEVASQPTSLVPRLTEAKPVLADLWKAKPMIQQSPADRRVNRNITQKLHVGNDLFVQRLEMLILAVKKQKWVDEQRQVVDQRNVERTVFLQYFRGDAEKIAEIDRRGCRTFLH